MKDTIMDILTFYVESEVCRKGGTLCPCGSKLCTLVLVLGRIPLGAFKFSTAFLCVCYFVPSSGGAGLAVAQLSFQMSCCLPWKFHYLTQN